ncbi:MAG TPA: hypothetical protein PLF11_14060 [Bacillota bacterium]|nr:hypothetical protein [Bacillota bacterium]
MSPNDRTPTPLEVCRELVEDVEALGGMEYVDREWPDMAVTYEHALAAIAKAKYEERRAAPALLAMLIRCEAMIRKGNDPDLGNRGPWADLVRDIRAAIAAAEGEHP